MDDKERPAIGKPADKLNPVVGETTPKTAQASIDPDPEDVAGSANEQMYVPEATNTVASHSGRITPTYESMLPSFVEIPRSKKPTSNKSPKMPANRAAKGTTKKLAKKSKAKKKLTKPLKLSGRSAVAKKTRHKTTVKIK